MRGCRLSLLAPVAEMADEQVDEDVRDDQAAEAHEERGLLIIQNP